MRHRGQSDRWLAPLRSVWRFKHAWDYCGVLPEFTSLECECRSLRDMEAFTIKSRFKSLLRSPSIKLRKTRSGNIKESVSSKVTFLM